MSGRLTNQDHEIADLVVSVGMPTRLDDVAEGEVRPQASSANERRSEGSENWR